MPILNEASENVFPDVTVWFAERGAATRSRLFVVSTIAYEVAVPDPETDPPEIAGTTT
jgi:hypothetical protein